MSQFRQMTTYRRGDLDQGDPSLFALKVLGGRRRNAPVELPRRELESLIANLEYPGVP
jgi:hypothetical protein